MDRISEIETFVAIVEQGGFTGAANHLGQSKSSISKHLSSLEDRLGASLLNRTTRSVQTTEIGQNYYHRCVQLLEDFRDAENMVVAEQSEPQGSIRLSVGIDFAHEHINDLLPAFLAKYEKIDIEANFNNRFVDLVEERFDLAIRIGNLPDSSLKVRKLAQTRLRCLASPDYISRFGTPESMDQLKNHKLLHYANHKNFGLWSRNEIFLDAKSVKTSSRLSVTDGKTLLTAAIQGMGVAFLPCFLYHKALKSGELVPVLGEVPRTDLDIQVVYQPNHFAQPKLRAFIDFLVESLKGKGNENW